MPESLKPLELKPDGLQFIQEVEIASPPAQVWKTLVSVKSWWSQIAKPGTKLKLEPRAGGEFIAEYADGGGALHATVQHIEPGKLLRLSGAMGMSHLPTTNVFIFELQPKGKGTLLRFCQRTHGALTPDVQRNYQKGWTVLFAALKSAAEMKRRKR